MDIKEKAHEYALNVLSEQIKTIEEAYIDGYNSAKGIIKYDDIEYIDLGLESGTLWATKFIGQDQLGTSCSRMTFEDAKNFAIPTRSQFDELRLLTNKSEDGKLIIYGRNGHNLTLPFVGRISKNELKKNEIAIWLKDSTIEDNIAEAGVYYNSEVIRSNFKTFKYFVGDLLPVLIVSHK